MHADEGRDSRYRLALRVAPWHSGRIDGVLKFRVGPEVWLGNRYKGFTIQMETAEHWHPNNPFNAITITPGTEPTLFAAHLIEKRTIPRTASWPL